MESLKQKKSRVIRHNKTEFFETGGFRIFKDKNEWFYYGNRALDKGDKFISTTSSADMAFARVEFLNRKKLNGKK